MLIQSPIAWIGDRLDRAFHTVGSASDEEYWRENRQAGTLTVRRIGLGDLRHALTNGVADFAANRTDVIFLCVIYPLVGLVLARCISRLRFGQHFARGLKIGRSVDAAWHGISQHDVDLHASFQRPQLLQLLL